MEKMKEQLIGLECAKLAKEKGFGIETELVYHENKLWHITNLIQFYKGKYDFAPTQSLLQKWLREKKGIIVEVAWYHNGKVAKWISKTWEVETAKYKAGDEKDTYEEALEEGLKEALKLIKIERLQTTKEQA